MNNIINIMMVVIIFISQSSISLNSIYAFVSSMTLHIQNHNLRLGITYFILRVNGENDFGDIT